MRRRAILACVAAGLLFATGSVGAATGHAALAASASSPCQFQKSTSSPAFCDTFDRATAPNDSRSGALDPTVWGSSQISVLTNASQGQVNEFVPARAPAACGGGTVEPPANIQICKGQLFDTANDGGSQTIVAMYPRQPFDIAGRTGDVTFNVANDSLDGHAAWPTFVYTDQPVPAPYESAAGIQTYARNSFGFTMAGQVSSNCPNGEWSLDSMFTTTNYSLSSVDFSKDACVAMSNDPTSMSHVEVQISPGSVVVWASDPGSTSLTEIAHASLNMPLTRGLVWMEDIHYNAGKYSPGQENNTLGWDDLGFDGPILARDLGFDVPDNTQASYGGINTGWSGSATLQTRADAPVTQDDIDNASGALLEFNWDAQDETVPSVSLNGNPAITADWPGGGTYVWRTVAVSVPLSQVVTGQNSITFSGASGGIANFDLILAGAGGVPTCLDPSNCETSPTPSSSTTSPPPSPTPSTTPAPTPSASPTPSPTPSSTPSSTPPSDPGATLTVDRSQIYANGTDLPWISYGNDLGGNAWGEYGFHAQTSKLDSDLSTMHSQGITTARVYGLADGRAGITFDSSGAPTALDPEVMTDLDALNTAAAANGVYVNLVLLDSDFMENSVNLGGGVTGGGHGALIASNSSALQSVVIQPILKHLASDSNIFSVEVMNEPEACISGENSSDCSNPVTLAQFNTFASTVASEAHADDPGVLVTVGSASSRWVGQYKVDGLDYYELHSYNTGYAPSVESTPASSLGLDKPIVVGEYPAGSASAFKAAMDGFYAEGYAGAWVWSYGKVDSVGTYDGPAMTAWNAAHPSTQVGGAPAPRPTPVPAPTAAPSPTPEQITNQPCKVNGVSGTCSGTFTQY